jgi:CMP-N,N'-diacetyllegionaminic acid synthase
MGYQDRRVLAVVPARAGSKGIPDKNMLHLGGRSLIARAGEVLAALPWIDRRIISTDSERYAEEARAHGLEAPFLRPPALASDTAGAVETMQHALASCEAEAGEQFDVVLIIEPTSPLRVPADVEDCIRLLVDTAADTAVTVSAVDPKCHPHKVFRQVNGRLAYYAEAGGGVVYRQQLEPLYTRDGLCYALTRACLVDQAKILGAVTVPRITSRPVVNIDGPIDVALAAALLEMGGQP